MTPRHSSTFGAALLGAGLSLAASAAHAKPSWQLVYSEPNQGNALISIAATDGGYAWTVGISQQMGSSSPVGIRTTDGVTWLPMNLPQGSGGPLSMILFTELAFGGPDVGWMTGQRLVFPNAETVIWRTGDGGMLWTEVHLAAEVIGQLQALPTGEMFGVGGATLVRSLDGTTVVESTVPLRAGLGLTGVSMLNGTCGFAAAASPDDAGSAESAVLWSSDGGQSWTERGGLSGVRLRHPWFVNASLGWAAGITDAGAGVVARTTDGGQSFTQVALPDHPAVFGADSVPVTDCVDVRFFDDLRGVALCLGCTGNCDGGEEDPTYVTVFARSSDGGQSWQMDPDYEPVMTAPPFGDLMKFSGMLDMAFPSPNAGLLAGQNNLVLRYTAAEPEPEGWGPASCEPGGQGGGGTNPPVGGDGAGAASGATGDDSGCGCRLGPRFPSRPTALSLAVLGLLLTHRRRRR